MIELSGLRRVLTLRRTARRWLVVAYWALVLALIVTLALASRSLGPDAAGRVFLWFWWVLIVPPVLLRSVAKWSTRSSILLSISGAAVPTQEPQPMDERELSLHYKMHTKAFYLLQIFVPVGSLLLGFRCSGCSRW